MTERTIHLAFSASQKPPGHSVGPTLKRAPFWTSVVLLTSLGYWVFPGHTYLQADTQIYVPMMERIYNPVLFSNDLMVSHPYLTLTAYDEIATGLRDYAGLDFEDGLKLQQLLFLRVRGGRSSP